MISVMREKSTRLFIACILVFAQYNLVAQYTTHADSSSAQHTIPYQPKKVTGKSFIVPVQKIDSISGNEIKIGSHTIPIGRTMKEDVLNTLFKNKLLKRQ